MSSANSPPRAGGGVLANQTQHDRLRGFSPIITKYISSLHQELALKHHWGSGGNDFHTFLSEFPSLSPTLQHDLSTGRKSTFEAMQAHLLSSYASFQEPIRDNDLTLPLPQYYISTSHNTYLTGNQLSSDSSIEAYRNVLLRRCRSVEVDVWNGRDVDEDEDGTPEKEHRSIRERLGLAKHSSHPQHETHSVLEKSVSHGSMTRTEPRVLHGHTLTRDISFRSVCETIRDTAFINSELPVIISLEIHTSLEQQEMMLDIMRQTWSDMLLENVAQVTAGPNGAQALPSPAELRRKILVKVKYTPPTVAKKEKLQAAKSEAQSGSHAAEVDSSDDDEDTEHGKQAKKRKILPALSELGVYTRSYHFKSFNQPEAKIPAHVFSLSEKTLLEFHESSPKAVLAHNRDYMMRAYPKGLRFTSTNLNPPLFWRQGVQMAAMNWQGCDKGIMLNEAMFAGTGGYVLKPARLRYLVQPSAVTTAQRHAGTVGDSSLPAAELDLIDLNIELLAAQDIPLCPGMGERPFRPYISCTLHVETLEQKKGREHKHRHIFGGDNHNNNTAADEDKAQLKRRTQTHEGQSPDLRREIISFKSVAIDEEALSFLRIKVNDDVEFGRNELAGWACVRLDRLGVGIRTIRLFDAMGRVSNGMILVGITKSRKGGSQSSLPLR